MSKMNVGFLAFNSGIVSELALARVDLTRLKFAAVIQTNWMPRTTGPMMLRPGLGFVDRLIDDAYVEPFPFVFAEGDYAIIEFGDGVMRVRLWSTAFNIFDQLLTRAAVATTISDPNFNGGGTWNITSTGGGVTTIGSGELVMQALPLGSLQQADQTLTIATADQQTPHALRIVVIQGRVSFSVGSTRFGKDIVAEQELGIGSHSIAFVPAHATVYITLFSQLHRYVIATQCSIEPAGVMELPIPWTDTSTVRIDQSADVVYVASRGMQQRKIERRGALSWSLVLYQPEDGPFQVTSLQNFSMQVDQNLGNGIMTCSGPYFLPTMNGALFRLFANSSHITESVSGNGQFTDPIRVSGVGGARTRSWQITGTWVGTIVEQQSFDSATTGFATIGSFSANTASSGSDGLDNSIVWYRFGFDTGWTSGTATINQQAPSSAGAGVVRVTGYMSPTQVNVEILPHQDFQGLLSTQPTNDWQEGEWSDHLGWPSCVRLYQGRLWWFGNDRIWGSISDAYESYDVDAVGDSAPLDRTIGSGPVQTILWALPLQRMLIGLGLSESSIRSSALDTPITPTDFSLRDASTQGSADVDGVRVDTRGIFVQRSKRRIMQLNFNVDEYDYNANDLTALLPDLDKDFIKLVVQRQIDTRIHCLREDGTVLVLLFDVAEKVVCWYKIVTDGVVERMVVLPGDEEDMVYYYVARSVGGVTVRTVEKFAKMSEAVGGLLNKQADGGVYYTGAATSTVTGLNHLVGRTVTAWGDGAYLGLFTVSATGTVNIAPASCQNIVVGLSYTAQFQSAKLAWAAQLGTALAQKKRIDHLGFVLAHTHQNGLSFGQDFVRMEQLPLVFNGTTATGNIIYTDLDEPAFPMQGYWTTDARLCLQAVAPLPCTVVGAIIGMATSERMTGQ